MAYKLINKNCKLCFYRGGDQCYELGYLDNLDKYEPKSKDVNSYFMSGCKEMRLEKIKKLLNEHK